MISGRRRRSRRDCDPAADTSGGNGCRSRGTANAGVLPQQNAATPTSVPSDENAPHDTDRAALIGGAVFL